MEPVTVEVGEKVGVCVPEPVLEAVDDCEGVRPAASERVTVGEIVPESVPVDVVVELCVGVGDGVQRSSMLWLKDEVSGIDARVLLRSSRTLSVWLMARVLHVLAMPAAVHAAGAVQQVVVCNAREASGARGRVARCSDRAGARNALSPRT